MSQTNMDTEKNRNATAPMMEFMVPISEFDMEVKPSQRGDLLLHVEVVSVNDGMITLRKTGEAEPQGSFRPETTNEMRTRLIDDEEKEDK